MATKITVALEDDLDGGPAEETVRFGVDGSEYEIDLNKKNAGAFRRQLAPSSNMPAGRAEGSDAGLCARHQAASAAAASGRGRKTRASRSVSVGASRRALLSSTKPLREDSDAGPEPRPGFHRTRAASCRGRPGMPVADARLCR